jgi:hypothetical protein
MATFTKIASSVLGGQGSIGSRPFTVSNPAPPQGSTGGDAGNQSVIVDSPEAVTGAHAAAAAPTGGGGLAPKAGDASQPNAYGSFTDVILGPALGDAVLGAPVKP